MDLKKYKVGCLKLAPYVGRRVTQFVPNKQYLMEISRNKEYIDAEEVTHDVGYVSKINKPCPLNYARYANSLSKEQQRNIKFNCRFEVDQYDVLWLTLISDVKSGDEVLVKYSNNFIL